MTPIHHGHRHRLTLRRKVFRLLGGEGHTSAVVRLVERLLVLLIVMNVAAVVLESVASLSIAHGPLFHAFDLASVGVFSVEYLLRLWTCVEEPERRFHHPFWGRLKWMATPMAIIDLLAVLPFYLSFMMHIDLRALRVLRVLRILKLSRYSLSISVIVAVVRNEARAIGAVLFVMIVVMVFSASLMYLAEHEAQPHVFRDIPTAMWWAVVTLTTLGYGDMVPITPLGHFIGGITAVLGVGMIALPAGVLASGFSEEMRVRREQFRGRVADALEDGRLTRSEKRKLDEVRDGLGLSEDEAARILADAARGGACPHCGKPLAAHIPTTEAVPPEGGVA